MAADPTPSPGDTRLPAEPDLPGPFPVGRYATRLRGFLRSRERVRLIGEVCNYSGLRSPAVYFELRDESGAIPCTIWREELDRLALPEGALRDGVELVVAGGLDYFPGSSTASPRFNFRATHLRPAGDGDLLAQLARLRKRLAAEGIFEPQSRLRRPLLPRTIGVVTGGGSAARADVLAGLERRSWRGRIVFAHPPVQGRGAAPRIVEALTGLAAVPEVETIVLARGGGSLADLWCFCDEALCRAVSMLRVPVIAAVGHETDRTLIDDVAAVSCSTPTHAAETAVAVDVAAERAQAGLRAAALARLGRAAAGSRARALGTHARALSRHARGERDRLRQLLREVRAASRRSLGRRREQTRTHGLVLARRRRAGLHEAERSRSRLRRDALALRRAGPGASAERGQALRRLTATLAAHDPERVLERGFAIVEGPEEELIATAAEARRAGRLRVRFADDDVRARVIDDE